MYKIYWLLLFLSFAACNSTDTTNTKPQENDTVPVDTITATDTVSTLSPIPERWKQKASEGIDFIATGNEPFWSLEIDEEKFIRYTTPEGVELTTPPVNAVNVDDATKLYKAETDTGKIELRVTNKMCINDMSGDSLAYTVDLTIKLKKDKTPRVLHGCGTSLRQ